MSGQLEDNDQKNSTPPNDRTTHFHCKPGTIYQMMTNENHQWDKQLTPESNSGGNPTDLNTNIELRCQICNFYGLTVSLSFLT